MDRKIGNYLVSLLVLGFSQVSLPKSLSDASVLLRVVDQKGKPLKKAGIGIPFLIDVEVMTSTRREQRAPMLTTPPQLQVVHRGTSNTVRSINGEAIIKNTYTYQAVADEEGPITIGPATVELKGESLESNTVTLTVGPEQTSSEAERQSGSAFVELNVSNKEPFVGEAVLFTIRFYKTEENAHLEQLQEPLFKGFRHTALEGPATGRAKIEGMEYQYLEWRALIFPTQDGRLVIPSLLAYVTVPVQHPRNSRAMDMFSLVNQMFGAGKTEQIYSNALTLQVKKLPPHEPSVTAVGKFSSFHAKLSSDKAETGEGITLTLELVGQGNFQMIGHPRLALPEGLKHYDSHAKDQLLTEKMIKKDFEYVVQAVKPGTYEIPAQTFTYFDPKTREYKTLQSRPVKLTVEGQARKDVIEKEEQHEASAVERPDELPSLEKTLKGGGRGLRQHIGWPLFWILVLLCMIPLLLRLGYRLWLSYQVRNAATLGYNKAFKVARSRIKTTQQKKNEPEVYHILMDLFAARLQIPRAELSETDIENALRKAGLSEEKIIEWRKFFAHVMAVTFSALPAEGNLYEQVSYWLMILERLL